MEAIGNKGRRTDPAAHTNAVQGDQFVAEEANHARCGYPAQLADLHGMDEAHYRLVTGHRRRQRDHRHHEQTRQVLGTTKSIGVTPCRGARSQCEGNPERNGGERVGEVVDGVGRQCHRSRYDHNGHLESSGHQQRHQADLDRPGTGSAGAQRVIDAVGGVVAVWGDDLRQQPPEPCPVLMVVVVVEVMSGGGSVVAHHRPPFFTARSAASVR